MATLHVDQTRDFRSAGSVRDITQIHFRNQTGSAAIIATFAPAQFGPGLIEPEATIQGGAAADTVSILFPFTPLGTPTAHFSAAGLTFLNWSANDVVRIEAGGYGNLHITGTGQDDFIAGGGYDGRSYSGNDTLYGGQGNDTLLGGFANDRLYGDEGDDYMEGGYGADRYYVDSPGDIVVEELAVPQADFVYASIDYTMPSGIERLFLTGAAIRGEGQSRSDRIDGNSAANLLKGHAGDDTLMGAAGNDTLQGGDGRDLLDGGAGLNALYGGSGDDKLQGRASHDVLRGDSGADLIDALAGNDTLTGGKGNDTMDGGEGLDLFVFSSVPGSTNNDRIVHFSVSDDRFDLSGGLFTAVTEIGADTVLAHAGGTARVVKVTGLTIDDWNSLVVMPDPAASADRPAQLLPAAPLFDTQADFF